MHSDKANRMRSSQKFSMFSVWGPMLVIINNCARGGADKTCRISVENVDLQGGNVDVLVRIAYSNAPTNM